MSGIKSFQSWWDSDGKKMTSRTAEGLACTAWNAALETSGQYLTAKRKEAVYKEKQDQKITVDYDPVGSEALAGGKVTLKVGNTIIQFSHAENTDIIKNGKVYKRQ